MHRGRSGRTRRRRRPPLPVSSRPQHGRSTGTSPRWKPRHVSEVEAQDAEVVGVAIDGDLLDERLPAARLEVGQTVLIEVDSVSTLVLIMEIEDDPYQDDDLQITYQVTGDEARAGQLGVTSLGRREEIPVAG